MGRTSHLAELDLSEMEEDITVTGQRMVNGAGAHDGYQAGSSDGQRRKVPSGRNFVRVGDREAHPCEPLRRSRPNTGCLNPRILVRMFEEPCAEVYDDYEPFAG